MKNQVRHEIVVLMDDMRSVSDRLALIQSMVTTEKEVKALKILLGLSIEYITHLNLILIKSPEEFENERFQIQLILGEVEIFIGEVHSLKMSMHPENLNRAIGAASCA